MEVAREMKPSLFLGIIFIEPLYHLEISLHIL
jgi:hypothetical protein